MMITLPTNLKIPITKLVLILPLLSLWAYPARAEQAYTNETLTYSSFIELVNKNHPGRFIDEKALARAREVEERSGLLPDPELKLSRTEVPLGTRSQIGPDMAKDDAEWQLALSQSFPWPGTLSAEVQAAKAEVASVEIDAGLEALQRRFEAKELYLRLIRTAKLLDIERRTFSVVDSIRKFTHEKFKQGVGSHLEFLQAHSESEVLKANIRASETDLRNLKRHALLLAFNTALDALGSVAFHLEWPPELLGPSNDKAGSDDLAREKLVRGKDAKLARKDAEYQRTMPSFMASGMLMQEDSGMRMYGAMVGITLPVYSGIKRRSLSAEEGLLESRSGSELAWHDQRKALALSLAESRLAQIEANQKSLEREIIPPVKEHIEAATIQFSQGKGDIGSIIEGQRTLLNLQVTEIQMTEALVLAHIVIEKIKAGLFDETMDLEVPRLPGIAGSNMRLGGYESMTNMPPMERDMPTKNGKAKKKPRGMETRTLNDEPTPNSPGMGM